jgi:hypothetical protein
MKHIRECKIVAKREGAQCVAVVHQGNTHIRLLFEAAGATFALTIPSSPSSPSSPRYLVEFRADVRRRLRAAA